MCMIIKRYLFFNFSIASWHQFRINTNHRPVHKKYFSSSSHPRTFFVMMKRWEQQQQQKMYKETRKKREEIQIEVLLNISHHQLTYSLSTNFISFFVCLPFFDFLPISIRFFLLLTLDRTAVCFRINQQKIIVLNKSLFIFLVLTWRKAWMRLMSLRILVWQTVG